MIYRKLVSFVSFQDLEGFWLYAHVKETEDIIYLCHLNPMCEIHVHIVISI